MATTTLKFPIGFRGILKTSTQEADQEELFYPTDPRLIAVNHAGDIEMGSLVCDLTNEFEIDPDRMARLHSIVRVVKKPFGGNNALALQIGPSGKEDTAGYVIDRWDEPNDPKKAVAQASWHERGPLRVGCPHDKHIRGKDDDGYPINPLHLWTGSLFKMDDVHDGPLRFELPYKRGGREGTPRYVTLGWDPKGNGGEGDWAWWTTIPEDHH